MSQTCRCPICGTKNTRTNTNARHYAALNIGRDESGRNWDRLSDDKVRRLARHRMNNNDRRTSFGLINY